MFKVAILQKRSINEQIDKNIETIIMAMEEASEKHADILLLPECFITGYDLPMSYEKMILPSVDHLYVLSRLLKVHMEDLLVPQCESIREVEMCVCISSYKRLSEYWKRLYINKCA